MSTCSTRSWWITRWFKKIGDNISDSENRKNWEKWKRRIIAIDSYILLFEKSKTKSLDGGKCPVSMTNHTVGIGTCTQGMAIPSYLSSEMHLQKFPDQTKFSELGREFPSRNLRKGEESRARAWSRDKRKGATFLHRAGDWRMFSARDNWVLFKKRHLIVFHTRMPRDSVRLCGKKWETEGKLTKNKHPLQYRKWSNRLTWKRSKSKGQSCDWSLKSLEWKARWKRSSCDYRHHPVCRGYKSGNRCMCGIRCLFRHADGEK